MADQAKEYVWACELSKEKPTFVFSFKEEDEDEDYLIHTLFLKTAVLGISAVENERNLIQMETKDSYRKDLKAPIASLTRGKSDMCALDLSFGEEVTFRLVEGTGPVFLSAQEIVEYPEDANMSQDEDTEDYTETEEEDLKETEEEESPKKGAKSKKRKASTGKAKGKAKSEDEDEEMESEEEEEEEEEDEEEEVSSPEKKKSSKKDSAKGGKKVAKKASKAVKKGKK
ncbi:mitotic apparatus protein p62-like isoform X2 [Saccostrea echinata]|uniref:mitotic apparatus protein p62-like isoform X2 n=1 Tax=Saccostrea echinata TaxID=191078 RepID=UPI002A81E2DC|nr:mitotic apparatus protein p62-like isoform X2 [Saccostrea echinata]